MANMTQDYDLDTLAIRAGTARSQFGEHSEALYLTSSFVFENAAHAARRFSGEEEGMVYARFSNPTVSAMQTRLAALEQLILARHPYDTPEFLVLPVPLELVMPLVVVVARVRM